MLSCIQTIININFDKLFGFFFLQNFKQNFKLNPSLKYGMSLKMLFEYYYQTLQFATMKY